MLLQIERETAFKKVDSEQHDYAYQRNKICSVCFVICSDNVINNFLLFSLKHKKAVYRRLWLI